MPAEFVHLHAHSHYSLRDSINKIPEMIGRAAEAGMPALALTDHGVMFGAVEFYAQAKEAGVKPIIGMEAYVAPGPRTEQGAGGIKEAAYHLTLLAADTRGYKNLMRLATAANVEGFYYRPRIDKEILAECAAGLIGLSGCLSGEAAARVLSGQREEAKRVLGEYSEILGEGNFYVEIMRTGAERQQETNAVLMELAGELGLELVATNDVHYLEAEDAGTHELWLAVGSSKTINDPGRRRMSTNEYYMRTPEEMGELFRDVPEAVRNTVKIAERAEAKIELGVYHFPRFDPGEGRDTREMLSRKARAGAVKRYGDPLPGNVEKRLENELETMNKMGFADYMLIVQDVVDFARRSGIPVGPGRGSAVGSVVCYSLGITDLDPLPYDLIFGRFINEGRNEMPDIDLDFAPEGRAQIIRHLEDTYGSDSVRPIVAFSELKAKAAIKDVARALEIPPSRADAVCKFIPSVPAMTLEEALGNIPEVRDAYEKDAEMREVIDRAKGLEGVVRQCTVHASGVVIGDKALENYTPLYYNPSTETVTTQYEMKVIDKVGLLKVDILGLATLSLVRKTLEIIEQTGKEVPDLEKLATDDKETFRLLGKGRSKGIFQFESEGMRRLLQQARPSNIEDLIALNALFRPGPLKNGFTDMWVKRKHGREKTTTLHPLMDEVLRPTYGVIVYQEQVMRLASELAGFTLSEADSLRRAMGKKDEETMERFRAIFVAGAKTRGIEERTAGAVYDSMSRFAEYGFNKSHAAAYALVAYRTAYLKAHYPSEFMAALLSIESDPKKVVQYIDEARGMGINVLPPDVNESRKDFTVVENGVRFGLATVKGVGEKATDSIIGAREAGGAFGDIFDFVERVDTRLVNKQVLVTLAKAGALDSLDIRRKQALMVIEDVLAYASGRQTAANRGQVSLFAGGVEEEALRPQVPDVVEMPDQEMRKNEKEVLGFYVSSHPMNEYAAAVKEFVERGLGQTEELSDGEEVTVAGIVSGLVVKRSRRSGEQWAAVTLEDLEGQVEGIVYPSVYAEARDKLENDRLVFVRGRAKVEEGGAKIMADEVFTLAEAPAMLYSRVVVRVDDSGGDRLDRIRKAVRAHPGPVDFCIELCEDGQKVLIQAGEEHRVNPVEEFVEKLEEITGAGSVRKVGQARYRNGNGGRRGSSRRYGRGRR